MQSLLDEMQQCKSVKACIELALTDAYGEYEQASAWLTCIEAMFGHFDQVNVMGEQVALEGFDLTNDTMTLRLWPFAARVSAKPASHWTPLSFPTPRRLKLGG
jgi:hypothetical protein